MPNCYRQTFIEYGQSAVAENGIDGAWRRHPDDLLEHAHVVAVDAHVAHLARGLQPLQRGQRVLHDLSQRGAELDIVNL